MRIFNRIRRKLLDELKIKSYFFYALGEVLLIVVGILIALQINNSNEESINLRSEQRILTNLKESFLANQNQIRFSLNEFNTIKNDLVLRILNTGPNKELPGKNVLDSLSFINGETINLAYDGVNHNLNQNELSLLNSKDLRTELAHFTIAFMKYKVIENNALDLTFDLRQIHQKYISILNEDINNRSTEYKISPDQFPSDYLGWLRDRDHQNKAVECKWKVEDSIRELKELYVHNQKILEVIEKEIKVS